MLMTVNNAITRPQGQSESEACGKYALMHTLRRLHTHTHTAMSTHADIYTRGRGAVGRCNHTVTE